MAMPPETPTPCRVKLIKGPPAEWPWSFPLPEAVADQAGECDDGLRLVGAGGFDGDAAALVGGQHHHPHDAFGIDPAAVAREPDVALKLARERGQLGRGTRDGVPPGRADEQNQDD